MKYHLSEIFDFDELAGLCQSFTDINGIVTAILDLEGNIYVATGWQPVCTLYHRVNEETKLRCTESDTILAGQLKKGNKYNIYKCKNGLIDIAVPIIVGNMHVGNFFSGQFLTEKPDVDFFRKQAKTFGFDEGRYLQDLNKVPLFTEDAIQKNISFLVKLTETIGNIGLKNIQIKEQSAKIEQEMKRMEMLNQELVLKNDELVCSEEEIRASNEELLATTDALKDNLAELEIARESAEHSKRLQQMLFEILPIGLALTTMTGELVTVNKAYTEIIGYTEEETLKLTYWDITPEKYLAWENEKLNQLALTGFYGPYEKEYRHKSGELVPVRLLGRIVTINNEKYIWSSVENISEKKEQEQELFKAKVIAEENDRLKTAFLQNMSHEIRTPLNAICGFSGMLNKPELSTEKRMSFVTIIQNSSNQLLSIVSDILTISSLETKQEKLAIEEVCVNNIIIELLAIFKQQAINQNISLYAKQSLNDNQSQIFTDKTKLTQIMTNLISNAIKFTHEGYIEFGYILKPTEESAELEFYVKDSGIGIQKEMYEKIFERFRQADTSINKKYGGTGLGLAISKSFVELLDGRIWLDSKPGSGSTFYFTIPYKPVHEMNKAIFSDEKTNGRKTILVAEDEEYNFLLIEELLSNFNLNVIHAKDGLETVDICKANSRIDLILMDIKMPVMDGYEAAILIKSVCPALPIVAQSAYALEHEKAKYESIFDDYLTKPLNEDELIRKVNKYITLNN
jgi:PAS domain S-box-containing protein